MSKPTIIVENLSIAELATYLGGFCDDVNRYLKFQKNHKGFFREILKNASHQYSVTSKFGQHKVTFIFEKQSVPDEVVAAVQKFFKTKKVSNAEIKRKLEGLPYQHYLAEYTMENPKRFDAKFNEFMDALTQTLNRKWPSTFEFRRKANATRKNAVLQNARG